MTTDYVLDGDRVLVETRSNGITLFFTYDVDSTLLSMNYNGNEYFYITNMQGDIIELVDINGNSVVKYKYDAWGNIISQTGGSLAEINPYRYRGYRYDVETGWYYLQSRYYDPAIGRFISADGLLGETGNLVSHNMYAYANNNPVIYMDPIGDFALVIPLLPVISKTVVALLLLAAAIIVIANETETTHTRIHQDDYSVYLCYDKQGELFYVGISINVERRMREHMRNPDFAKQFGGKHILFSNISQAQARVIETGIILGHDGLTNVRYSIGEQRYPQRSLIWNKIKYDILPHIP